MTLLVRLFATAAALVFLFELVFNRSFRCFFLSIALFLGVIAFVSARMVPIQPPADSSAVIEAQALRQPTQEAGLGSQADRRNVSLSETQTVVAAVALSVLVVSVLALGLHRWLRKKSAQPVDRLDAALETIETAARRLRAGEDARTVVLYCYQEMMRILSAAGRLDATCLTPREFELKLHQLGLSGDSIQNLTTLFEVVRYAGRVGDNFASEALTCLDAVREAQSDKPKDPS